MSCRMKTLEFCVGDFVVFLTCVFSLEIHIHALYTVIEKRHYSSLQRRELEAITQGINIQQ